MTAEEFLKQVSPNDKFGIRADLKAGKIEKHVIDIMERYAALRIHDVVGQSERLVSFLRQYQKSCEIMHVGKIDAKNFVEQYKTN